ncbi:Protease 3 precursor [Candidatus Rubidus massiliensis]|nr:Protease 3 precursor [Candidatus Rubidus massiliensis]
MIRLVTFKLMDFMKILPLKILGHLLLSFIFFTNVEVLGNEKGYTVIEDKATLPLLNQTFEQQKRIKIKLDNGLEALIISDPKTDQSSAVLTVKAGSWNDPERYPGMAHFTEHLLFLGTKDYPDEAEYMRFISENGGLTNAFTANDYTAYMFSVNNEAFASALNRFSSFFKNPLFNQSGVSRELNAIDQEFAKNYENDDFRLFQVLKEIGEPIHPNNRFSIGNSITLKNISRETVQKWYEEHYSANVMKVIVLSNKPLDELIKLTVNDFGAIKNKNLTSLPVQIPIDAKETEGKFIYVQPLKNIRTLSIIWNLPHNIGAKNLTKPSHVLCYVLGHEGEGSLLHYLKDQGLAEGLQCGVIPESNFDRMMYLSIDLTDKGLQSINQVIQNIFQTISLFKENNYPEYLFKEMQTMEKLKYQYQKRKDVFSKAMRDAMILQEEPLSSFPEQSSITSQFSLNDINNLVNYLTPEHARFYIQAPFNALNIEAEKKEKWMGVEYAIKPINPELLKSWQTISTNKNIFIPTPNPFIPKELNVIGEKTNKELLPNVQKLIDNQTGLIYFAKDDQFQEPEIYWYAEIKTPLIQQGKSSRLVVGDLLVKFVEDALIGYGYKAALAGLDYKIARTDNGISFKITGYSENAHLLFKEIVSILKNLQVNEEKFTIFKQSLLRDYQNVQKDPPIKQAFELFKHAIYKDYVLDKKKLNSLRKLDYDKFAKYVSGVFQKTYIQGLFYGNMEESQANDLGNYLIQQLVHDHYPKEEQFKQQVVDIPETGGPFYIEQKTKVRGNAVVLGIQWPEFSFSNKAAQLVLMQGMEEPFFSDLRTKQQTAYIVKSAGEEFEKKLFNIFAIQSNTHDTRDLLSRFELFIERFLQEIPLELSLSRFDNIKKSLLEQLKQPQKNSTEMGELLKNLAFKHEGDFERLNKMIQSLESLQYDDLVKISLEWMGRTNRRRLAILLKGVIPETNTFDYNKITNLQQLRAPAAVVQ